MTDVQVGVGVALPVAILLPHIVGLHRVTPAVAALVWLCALSLRALVAVGGALFVFVYMPQTGVYAAVADWCLHEVLPLIAAHLGLSGHPLVHAAIVVPGLALAASVLWLLFGLTRAWLLVRAKLRRALGEGPHGSTIIEEDGIVVGVTGVGRSRILISRAALGAMDSDELEASLSHELGHIHRRHRPLLLLASLLVALGRMLPGTRTAERELRFSLERDADDYAVRRTRDPLALASAICKAASSRTLAGTTSLAGSGRVTLRLDYLEGQARRADRGLERGARVLAAALVTVALGLSATLPTWALAVPQDVSVLSTADSGCHHGKSQRQS